MGGKAAGTRADVHGLVWCWLAAPGVGQWAGWAGAGVHDGNDGNDGDGGEAPAMQQRAGSRGRGLCGMSGEWAL